MKNEKLKAIFLVAKDRLVATMAGGTSVMITYYLVLSVFPMFIAVGNILPLFGINAAAVTGYLDMIIPQPLLVWLLPIIDSLLGGTSGALLSIGLIVSVWSASKGVSFLQKGMNKAYGIPDKGSFIARRLVSMVTIFLILLLLVAFALVYSFGVTALQALAPELAGAEAVIDVLELGKWPVMIVFIFLMLMIVYRVTPDVKLKFRQVWPGAIFGTAGLLIMVQLFTFYLRYITRSLSSYGALGAFFLLMVWINLSVRIVLIGAVMNATIGEYYHGPAEEVRSGMENVIDKLQARLWAWVEGLFRSKEDKPAEEPPALPAEAPAAEQAAMPQEGLPPPTPEAPQPGEETPQ